MRAGAGGVCGGLFEGAHVGHSRHVFGDGVRGGMQGTAEYEGRRDELGRGVRLSMNCSVVVSG